MLFNLMSNALKFTNDGSVTLSVQVETADDGAEQLVLSVADTGIGIAADQHEHIFESFKQVDGGMSRQFGGTGLGLAICQRLATALGGNIAVKSELGDGSIFTIRLPLERYGVDEPATAQNASTGPGLESASLLIVDGNPGNLGMLGMMLAGVVGSVAVASSVDHAIEIVGQQTVTHIVFDANCAVSGDETPAEVLSRMIDAANGINALLSITVAPGPDVSIADAMMAGAAQVIVKPISGDELIEALQSLYGPSPETFIAPSLDAKAA